MLFLQRPPGPQFVGFGWGSVNTTKLSRTFALLVLWYCLFLFGLTGICLPVLALHSCNKPGQGRGVSCGLTLPTGPSRNPCSSYVTNTYSGIQMSDLRYTLIWQPSKAQYKFLLVYFQLCYVCTFNLEYLRKQDFGGGGVRI